MSLIKENEKDNDKNTFFRKMLLFQLSNIKNCMMNIIRGAE